MSKGKHVTELETAPAIIVEETKALAKPQVSGELIEQLNEVMENFESIENPQLPRTKMTSTGFELAEGTPIVTELTGTIVLTKKTNVFYARPYNPNEPEPPTCVSYDGVTPEKDLRDADGKPQAPVHPTCKGCPMAEFGTNQMKSGKACRNLKPIYLLLDKALMPRQISITPTSLKAANQYLMNLAERGLAYRKVLTKITAFNKTGKDTYVTLKFEFVRELSPQEAANTDHFYRKWLPLMQKDIVVDPQQETFVQAEQAPSGNIPFNGQF